MSAEEIVGALFPALPPELQAPFEAHRTRLMAMQAEAYKLGLQDAETAMDTLLSAIGAFVPMVEIQTLQPRLHEMIEVLRQSFDKQISELRG